MRQIVFIFCILLSSSAHAACTLPLEDVLEYYVETRGGAAAIGRQDGLHLVSIHHEGKWNPVFDYRVMKPGYMWIAALYDDGEIIVEGFDGRRGWEKWGSKPAKYVDGDAQKALNQGAMSPVHLYGLHQMSELGAQVSLTGCQEIDERHHYVINVVSKFGTGIDYLVDSQDFRLKRSRSVRPLHPTLDSTPITIEERWSDFRNIGGVLHPFRAENWDLNENKRLSWLEVLRIEPLGNMKENNFARPE